MKFNDMLRASLLATAIALTLTGCGDDEKEMNQQEVEYLSQLDQARFFQQQGELKASTREARSAIEMNPDNVAPYLIIIDNLIISGDARNAAQQIKSISENLDDSSIDGETTNQIELLRARSRMMLNQPEKALAVLDKMQSPKPSQKLEAADLRGQINHRMGNPDVALKAYKEAREIDSKAVMPLVGLSRLAFAKKDMDAARDYIKKAESLDNNDSELWLWKAQFAQAQEQWEDAENAYSKALDDIGKYDIMTYRKYQTMSALITVLREQGKSSEAYVYEEILAKSAPGTIKSNYSSAKQAYTDGDLKTTIHYLEENVKNAPGHVPSALMLGMIRFREGRVDEAEKLLKPIAQQGDSLVASKLLAASQLQLQQPEQAKELLNNLSENQNDPDILSLVGIATLATGDEKAGRQYIEKSLALQPKNSALRLRYARYLIQKKHYDDAIEQAEKVRSADDSNDEARVLIIQAHMGAGRKKAALQSASAWVKAQPGNTNALITHGDVSLANGEGQDARKFYKQAMDEAKDDPRPDLAMARLNLREKQTDKALDLFKAAVRKAPDNRQALQGFMATAEKQDAKPFLKQILSDHPEATGPRLILLEMALQSGDTTRADELTAKLIAPESESQPSPNTGMVANIYTSVATRKARNDKASEAEAILNRAQALFAENENVSLQAAGLQFRMGNDKKARKLLKQTRLDHPDSVRPYLLEARHAYEQKKFGDAAELYKLALGKDGGTQVATRYAQALQKDGQKQEALKFLKKSAKSHEGNIPLRLALAVAYQNNDDKKGAIDTYESILEIDADNAVALNNLAWMYHKDDNDKALSLAEKAFKVSPDSPAIADTYGWILFKQGEQQQSISILEKAHKLAPDTEEIALHLAEAYKATGQSAKAKEVLKKM